MYASSGNSLDIFSIFSTTQFNSQFIASGDIATLGNLTAAGNASIVGQPFGRQKYHSGRRDCGDGQSFHRREYLTATGTITGSSLTSLSVINASGGITAGGPGVRRQFFHDGNAERGTDGDDGRPDREQPYHRRER